MIDWASTISYLLKALKISDKELAKRLNLWAVSSIGIWEVGQMVPSKENQEKILAILKENGLEPIKNDI